MVVMSLIADTPSVKIFRQTTVHGETCPYSSEFGLVHRPKGRTKKPKQ